MAKGRNRKPGKRTKSGQLSRAGMPKYDKGTEQAQAKADRYGTNGCDAIGRAFEHGLLGKGQDAKLLLDYARSINRVYWSSYETGPIRCTLADRGGGAAYEPANAKAREDWLNDNLAAVNALGPNTRRAFDELVIDPQPDCGPHWLDMILSGHGIGYLEKMSLAQYGLWVICGLSRAQAA